MNTIAATARVHIISVGGGIASTWKLPERVIALYGKEHVRLVLARLPNEDPDVWRLCDAVQEHLGIEIEYIGLNQTPWDVFFKVRMMGSSRIDPCSRVLKRQVVDRWVSERFRPTGFIPTTVGDRMRMAELPEAIRYIGFTAEEAHRLVDMRAAMHRKGWHVEAPLIEDTSLTRENLIQQCRETFGFVPRLYLYGFTHNNCGGACVKAGLREWARLLRYLPDVYAWWEENEARFMREIGTPATILRDRRRGKTHPLSLATFRERMQAAWTELLPGMDPLEIEGLDDTPACAFCGAA